VSETLLQAENLFCERDRRILFQGLNLSVSEGEVLQVEGANGSGKTTLLRILTGLSEAYEGEILWCGEPLYKMRHQFRSQTQYLGHGPGIKATLTAEENLRWYAALAGCGAAKVDDVLAEVGLRGYEDMPCHQLSAGQQRRVNLARLRMIPARLWILDEPFTAIDKAGIETIESLIESHVVENGAVIITSHQDLQSMDSLRTLRLG